MRIKLQNCTKVLAIASIILLLCKCKNPIDAGTLDAFEWQTVFFDDFDRSDGAAGNNYLVQIEGGSGVLSVLNNMLQLSGGGFYAIRYFSDVTDDVIRVSVKCSTAAVPSGSYGFGVSVKSRNLGNDWMLQELYNGSIWVDKDSIAIYKISGIGLPPPLISIAYDVQKNRTYSIELTVNKKDITFVVKDLFTGKADTLNAIDTGALLTGGTVGINGMQGDSDIIYFDDFKIEKYE